MDRKIIPAAVAIVVMLAIIIAALFFVFHGEEDYRSVENLSSRMAIADGERQDPDDNKTDAYRNADSRFGRRKAEELMESMQDDITMPTTDEAGNGNAYAAPASARSPAVCMVRMGRGQRRELIRRLRRRLKEL